MKETLKKAVENQSEEELKHFLDFRNAEKVDSDQFELVEKVLQGTWQVSMKTW